MLSNIYNLISGELSFWSYPFLALVAILEATPIFGFFVPGQVIAVTAGFLAHTSSLNIWSVFLFLSVGAILGDLLSYLLGVKYGEGFILKYGKYFFLKRENFLKTKELITNHTGKTIVIGRFNSITRSFTPMAAGLANVPFLKFIFYDTIGGISWAIFFACLGYIFGNNYKHIANYLGEFLMIALLVGGAIIYLYKRINKKRKIFHRRHLYILFINLFSLYILVKMLDNFAHQELFISWDQWIQTHVQLLWNPLLTKIMIIITHLGGTISILSASAILLIFFILKKKWRYSSLLFLSLGGGKLLEISIKHLMERNRPAGALIEATGFSLPSGHATANAIFFAILIYYFKNHISNRILKYILITLSALMTLAVGFSRIYLSVHWFTDVVAGLALGIFWFTLSVLILEFISSVFKEKVSKLKKYLNR